MSMLNLAVPIILALTPLDLGGMLGRRAAIAALASTAALTATPALAFSDPLSRLADNTKNRRLRQAAARALEVEEQQQPPPVEQQQQQPGTEQQQPVVVSAAPVAEEAVLSTSAGLAKIDAKLNEAYELAEDVKSAQLRRLLRSPVFASFLGFTPGNTDMERQVALLLTFPSKSRVEAAETLRDLNVKLRDLYESLASSAAADSPSPEPVREPASASALTAAVAEAKALSQQFTKLYLVDGCLACPDQIKGSAQSEFSNPNLRKLKEFEPRLLRRPDERDEVLARRLGFREGELIGGYD